MQLSEDAGQVEAVGTEISGETSCRIYLECFKEETKDVGSGQMLAFWP